MNITLNFDTLAELQEFAQWANGRGQYTDQGPEKSSPDTRPVTGEGAVIGDDDHEEGPHDEQEPANAAAGAPSSSEPAPEPAPKRKRRTRAEIAADKADAEARTAQPHPEADPLDNLKPESEPAAYEQHAEIAALAAMIDGADKLAHMNEGREFISKHGFPKYNETFALADVPANIAAHTPEQGALHRAAMQWLAAQDGAK